MRFIEDLFQIILHGETDIEILLHDREIVLAVAPQLIRLAGVQISAAPVAVIESRDIIPASVAVHAKESGDRREFVPSDEQFPEIGVVHIIGHEASDVGSPPRYARQTHVYSACELIPERLPGARYIAGPDHVGVFLAASPA